MASVAVETEYEQTRGWRYEVTVRHDDGHCSAHTITLGWADHDYWCGGRRAPSAMVEAVVRYCLAQPGTQLPRRFDAAKARRWFPSIDHDLRRDE